MKKIYFCFAFSLVWGLLFADTNDVSQSLTLSYCYEKARNNHPLIKQFALAEQSAKHKSAGAGRHYLPQLSISARASWQTDVTGFSQDILDKFALMGISDIHFPDKDQYRAVVELVQPIWDGGALIFERSGIQA